MNDLIKVEDVERAIRKTLRKPTYLERLNEAITMEIRKAGANPGAISHRADGDYEKQPDGTWDPVPESGAGGQNSYEDDPQREREDPADEAQIAVEAVYAPQTDQAFGRVMRTWNEKIDMEDLTTVASRVQSETSSTLDTETLANEVERYAKQINEGDNGITAATTFLAHYNELKSRAGAGQSETGAPSTGSDAPSGDLGDR